MYACVCLHFSALWLLLTTMRPLLLFIIPAFAKDSNEEYYQYQDYIIGGRAADSEKLPFVVVFNFLVCQKICEIFASNFKYWLVHGDIISRRSWNMAGVHAVEVLLQDHG